MNNPTQLSQRIVAIDMLRGFALLGILVMNIQGFSMPSVAYDNPTMHGDLTGINWVVWLLSHMLTDLKMMNIFSMLFGAGIVLFTDRLEQRGVKPLPIHYRRTFWLLIIGLVHAYLIWQGDILVTYALCGFVVVLLRNVRPRRQFILGLLMLAVSAVLMFGSGATLDFMPPETAQELIGTWQKSTEALASEIDAYRGGWLAQMAYRVPGSLEMNTSAFFFWGFWRAGGLMLIGMALYKWGVFSVQRSREFYLRMLVFGLGIGLPIIWFGVQRNVAAGWDITASRFGIGYQFNYWASLLVSLAYISGIMLMAKSGALPMLSRSLAAVGRMALTNYLFHSIVATFLFYGHGLGWFGNVERIGQIMIVFAIWAVQLAVSPWWLDRYKFGPVEWLWRSLTYWTLQPMRK